MLAESPSAFDLTSVPVDLRLLELQAAKGGRKRSIGPLTPNAERQRRFRERRTQELAILAEENDDLKSQLTETKAENAKLKSQLKTLAETTLLKSKQKKKIQKPYALKMPFSVHQLRLKEKLKLEKKVDTLKSEVEGMRKQNYELLEQIKEMIKKLQSSQSAVSSANPLLTSTPVNLGFSPYLSNMPSFNFSRISSSLNLANGVIVQPPTIAASRSD
ncbi:hypothetical protein L596_012068 [Steinernema carpocapsae]|uniref:BZIP domain-containing protein n=1 Tax=Steinernema carpocapsae TaxID=34508 RepID=A0A4U5NWR1_STECR|nr:hypothetical protein L596_012068 [Steinernema carpocapsae]